MEQKHQEELQPIVPLFAISLPHDGGDDAYIDQQTKEHYQNVSVISTRAVIGTCNTKLVLSYLREPQIIKTAQSILGESSVS